MMAATERDLQRRVFGHRSPDGICDRKGCTMPALWMPRITVRAPAPYPPVPVAMYMGLRLCDGCKEEHADPADFLSPEGWTQIVGAFRALGRVTPDRASAVVDFVPLPVEGPGC